MSGGRLRMTFGRVLMSAVILALPLGLGGCLKGALPPSLVPPEWTSTTVGFFNQQIGNPATGWVTTVTVPQCIDNGGATVNNTPATVSTGSLVDNGGGKFTWTRAVSGSPAVAASGVFTVDCIDYQGLSAHPTLAVTAPALP
jgi:hypothetical protein